MSYGSNVRNSGIAHLAFRVGGQPLCKARTAHIVCTVEDASKWTVCKRCQNRLNKITTNRKASAAQFYADGCA